MPDDIPAQPLLVEIAIEPKSEADQAWLAQKGYVLAPREPSRVGGEALAPPITSESSGLRCQPLAAPYVEITGAWLALA